MNDESAPLEAPDEDPGNEIELISDGDGLVVIGKPAAVELFAATVGVPSRELDLRRLNSAIAKGGSAMQTASEVSANAGRWMQLTEESWQAAQHLPKVKNSLTKFDHATLRSPNGQFAKNLQFVSKPGAMLTNPALLAGVGGLMAQYAMQQTMEEITDYLAKIDAKVDDILRAQKDAVLAQMIGVELVLEEAMVVRNGVGRVSDVTWSKVQGTAETIAITQAHALKKLDSLAEKLEKTTKIADLADLSKEAQETVVEWLAVLAHCFQLQDGLGVLELDRVLDSSPHEIEEHRAALQLARQHRRERIATATAHVMARMDAAAQRANKKMFMNPIDAPAVVRASNHVAHDIGELHASLGMAGERQAVEARRWGAAAAEVRDDIIESGRGGAQAVGRFSTESAQALGRFGSDAIANLRVSAERLGGEVASKLQRPDESASEEPEGSESAGTDRKV